MYVSQEHSIFLILTFEVLRSFDFFHTKSFDFILVATYKFIFFEKLIKIKITLSSH